MIDRRDDEQLYAMPVNRALVEFLARTVVMRGVPRQYDQSYNVLIPRWTVQLWSMFIHYGLDPSHAMVQAFDNLARSPELRDEVVALWLLGAPWPEVREVLWRHQDENNQRDCSRAL